MHPTAMSFRTLRPLRAARGAACAILVAIAGLPGTVLAQEAGPAPQSAPAPNEPPAVAAQPATGVVITWEVKNRFRLFRDERDFRRHVDAEIGRSALAAEQDLAEATQGRGWARDMVVRLCLDAIGQVTEICTRDGVQENYLAPADHPVEVRATGEIATGASCSWSFADDADARPRVIAAACSAPVTFRPRAGRTTTAIVDISLPGEPVRRATEEIAVRDLLIAGLGDSVASGDGNPDRPVTLSDEGFCFRRFDAASQTEYFRPGRVGFKGDRACDSGSSPNDRDNWALLSARWMGGACHRSLYGHQLRAALALAVESPHLAVTFLPLACTGATIDVGLLKGQRSRELMCGSVPCPRNAPAQVTQLRDLLARAQRIQPGRSLDLVFLTIGANDISFPGLVADIIIDSPGERRVFSSAGIISTVETSRAILEKKLPGDFARLRAALRPLVDDAFERIVYVSYGNPALGPGGTPCPGGRGGFDINPTFSIAPDRLARASRFVQNRFLPALKDIASCKTTGACAAPSESMTFVDAHQAQFAEHGFCALADTDPPFDRECFLADGTSFDDSLVDGATQPLACGAAVSEFRAYATRARWIRTANDSYFAAMTFPEGVSAAIQPSNLHDATWGILSAVYGGAIHPTAEGHAAMADAALEGARRALHLPPPSPPVESQPLPPLAR